MQRLSTDATRPRVAAVALCADEVEARRSAETIAEQHKQSSERFELLRNHVAAELADKVQRRKRARAKPEPHWKSRWRGGDGADFTAIFVYCRQVMLATSDRLVLHQMMPSRLTRRCRGQLCQAPFPRGPMKNGLSMPAFTERWRTCNGQPIKNAYMMQEGSTRVSSTLSILRCCCSSQAVSFFLVLVNNQIYSTSPFATISSSTG